LGVAVQRIFLGVVVQRIFFESIQRSFSHRKIHNSLHTFYIKTAQLSAKPTKADQSCKKLPKPTKAKGKAMQASVVVFVIACVIHSATCYQYPEVSLSVHREH
jgi:hypothetical protein